jgi:hypothetical protein
VKHVQMRPCIIKPAKWAATPESAETGVEVVEVSGLGPDAGDTASSMGRRHERGKEGFNLPCILSTCVATTAEH